MEESVQFHALAASPPDKSPRYTFYGKPRGTLSRFACGFEKPLAPVGNRTPESTVVQPVARCYTGCRGDVTPSSSVEVLPTFRRNALLPSSCSKSKPSERQARLLAQLTLRA
jgi:hypothetical protein